MKMGEPRHATDPKRTAQDRSEYMANYMRDRRKSVRLDRISHVCATSIYDIGRHELRDGSGTLMWPLRVMGSETPMADGDREIAAAEKRRRSAPAAPIKTPTTRAKVGPGRRAFERNQPRRENHA
jgi:hypothetical protein